MKKWWRVEAEGAVDDRCLVVVCGDVGSSWVSQRRAETVWRCGLCRRSPVEGGCDGNSVVG